MQNITSESNFAPVSKTQIREFEKQIGKKLPKDYSDYLSNHNGADLINPYFHHETDDYYYWVDYLHHLDEQLFQANENGHYMSISFNQFKNGEYMPDQSIIIGTVVNEHQLLLRLDDSHHGEVWVKMSSDGMHYSENEEYWKNHKEENAIKLADSFTEFLSILVESDPYDDDDDDELLL